MRDDIKKKFLDILFEPEPEEPKVKEKVIAKAPLEDINVKKVKEDNKETEESVVQVKKTPFINLNETKEEVADIEFSETKEKGDKGYEYTLNISPIFGVIEEPKRDDDSKVSIDDSQTSKPVTSYLGTIISPIYGYDANRSQRSYEEYAKDAERNFTNKKNNSETKKEDIDDTYFGNDNNIEEIVDVPEEDVYSEEDEQLFKELSFTDIFKSDEGRVNTKKEKRKDQVKVSYTSLFDDKED